MNNELIRNFAVFALPILFAITLHEAAHAYAAKYFGDTTAYSQGRMSLNPMVHIDPVGTLLIPIVLYFTKDITHIPFIFGYAKPVPVDFGRLRNPKKQMAWVALAGPAANLFMAVLWLVSAIGMKAAHFDVEFFMLMAQAGVTTNLVIFAFNLFPIPPLDGGRILFSILPHKYAYKVAQLEPYGFFIVITLAYLHVLDLWMGPVIDVAARALKLIVSPLTFLLS